MKKIAVLLGALALMVGLSACGPTDKIAAEVDGVKISRSELFGEVGPFLTVQSALQGGEARSGVVPTSQTAQSLSDRIKIEVERKALSRAGITVDLASIEALDEQIISDLEQSMFGSFTEDETVDILRDARKVSRLFAEQNLIDEAFGKLVSDKAKPWFGDAEIVDYFIRNQKNFASPTLTDEARTQIVELLHTPGEASRYLLSKAKVKVDKRFGTWDPASGVVEPPVALRPSSRTPGIDLGE